MYGSRYWAKGTGYGFEGQDAKQWDAVAISAAHDEELRQLVRDGGQLGFQNALQNTPLNDSCKQHTFGKPQIPCFSDALR